MWILDQLHVAPGTTQATQPAPDTAVQATYILNAGSILFGR